MSATATPVTALSPRPPSRFGRVDVLVNAAGVLSRCPVLDLSADDWHHVLNVNVLGQFLMMVEAMPHMRETGGGRVVTGVPTTVGESGQPQSTAVWFPR